ncbi:MULTISPECIES: helix-turn-helix domain-containing protein [Enterococcus]|uniref:Helix-turn-helix domain-containing protein n=1 Tax=Candidatus Enterococcus murrayae TaxID=2815321 RepID=A0ABS3HEF5_9ENTE|nr:helix-turn-helix domain-containing protein [Enterococcus sp. MJM16]MBO0451843.1 helix-turn-helix domain-containing protein [Enterococcus sp. MJM16]
MLDNPMQYVFNYEFRDVTVKDLVKSKKLEASEVYADELSLDNIIKSATVMDVEDIVPWLHEGDVVFISRFMKNCFTNIFIQRILLKKVSCVITQKKFKKYVTDEQFELLKKNNLPIIFVSDSSSWSDLIVAIQNLIIQNQTHYLVENQEFQNSIINYLSSSSSQNSLCDIVHSLTGITIAITNRNLQLVDYSKDNDWESDLAGLTKKELVEKKAIGENFNELPIFGFHYSRESQAETPDYFVIPDRLSRYGACFYIIVKHKEETLYLSPQIIGRIETVESIYSLKHSIISDLRKSNYYFKTVVFEDLLEMEERDEKKRHHISLNLKQDLKEYYHLIIIKNAKDNTICKNVDLLTGFIDYIKHKGFADDELLLFVYKEHWIILIDDSIHSIKKTGDTIYELLVTYFENDGFVIGISNLHHYWELKQAFNEASFAVDYLVHNSNSQSTLLYNELGIIKLFTDQNSQINSVYTNEMYRTFLKPVLEYDKEQQTALYETLVTFFSNDLSFVKTSATLFIHVNTLRARIKTIEKILNVDTNRIDSLMNIRLAVLLYQFGYFEKIE